MTNLATLASSLFVVFAMSVHVVWPRVTIGNSGLKKKHRKKLLAFTANVCKRVIFISAGLGFIRLIIMGSGDMSDVSQIFYNLIVVAVHLWAASLTVNLVKDEVLLMPKIVANK